MTGLSSLPDMQLALRVSAFKGLRGANLILNITLQKMCPHESPTTWMWTAPVDSCTLAALLHVFVLNRSQNRSRCQLYLWCLYSSAPNTIFPTKTGDYLLTEGFCRGLCGLVRDKVFELDPSQQGDECPQCLLQHWRSSPTLSFGSKPDAGEELKQGGRRNSEATKLKQLPTFSPDHQSIFKTILVCTFKPRTLKRHNVW